MRWLVLTTAIVCLCLPGVAGAESRSLREALSRLSLVPVSPGGSLELLPVYPADAVPPAHFEIYLSDAINGQDVDSYLAERAMLGNVP